MTTQATTNSSGAFSVDFTSIGMTRVYNASAQTLDTASGVANTTVTSITGLSTTAVSGSVYQFSDLLGVIGLAAVGSGRTVYITVLGDLS